MSSDRKKEQLLERQARVYEVADVATKPAQWFIGGLKMLLMAVVVVAVLVGTPLYLMFTHQTVTGGNVLAAFNAVTALVLFFLCPYYVVLGGPLYFAGTAWWLLTYHEDWMSSGWLTPSRWFFVWVAIGYGWFFFKRWFKRREDSKYQRPRYRSTAVEVCPLAPYEPLTGDSPMPEDVQQILRDKLQSIIAVSEAVLERQRASQSMLALADIDHAAPGGDALNQRDAYGCFSKDERACRYLIVVGCSHRPGGSGK